MENNRVAVIQCSTQQRRKSKTRTCHTTVQPHAEIAVAAKHSVMPMTSHARNRRGQSFR